MATQKVLVAPLDWGLGHATRCIPLIYALRLAGFQPCIAGSGHSLYLLQQHFPDLDAFELPSYKIHYSASRFQLLALARQGPRVWQVVKQEHEILENLVERENIDYVISDNRYGLWSGKVPSILLCHQLALKVAHWDEGLSKMSYQFHMRLTRNFSQIWVPDFAGEPNLSGSLSHGLPLGERIKFIGPLSRFVLSNEPTGSHPFDTEELPALAAVLSGPEPQRSILEAKLEAQAQHFEVPIWIIQGKSPKAPVQRQANVSKFSFLDSLDLAWVLNRVPLILSRSGYTSLMDYAVCRPRSVVLVPTPGQPEQEYLARRAQRQGIARFYRQHDLKLGEVLAQSSPLSGFTSWERQAFSLDALAVRLGSYLQKTKTP